MKCLITGVAGFLGSALADELCQQGYFVLGLDNFITGTKSKIEYLERHKNFKFLCQDICTLDATELLKHGPFDAVFNLACPASPKFYFQFPRQTLNTCSLGLANVIELAKLSGAKLIQASTSEVYGEPATHPQREDYFGNVDPVGPRSCYDEGKRFGEALIAQAVNAGELKATILRIFNTYGPNMRIDDGRVVTNFISAAVVGGDIELYGTGLQTRSFCYQGDTVAAFIAAWRDCSIMGPINVGSSQEVTMCELATTIKRLTNSNSRIVNKPALVQDPSRRRADTSLALKAMGWATRVNNLEDGLRMTIGGLKCSM